MKNNGKAKIPKNGIDCNLKKTEVNKGAINHPLGFRDSKIKTIHFPRLKNRSDFISRFKN